MKFTALSAWHRAHAALVAIIICASPVSIAAASDAITVAHAQGQTTLSQTPERIVVFDPAVLDILHALDIKPTAVVDAPLPAHLSVYSSTAYPKVGTLFEPNYEAVYAQKPDLIVVASRSAPKYRDLSRLAPTIDLTVDPTDLPGSVKRNTLILAKIFGKQEQAEALLQQLDASMQTLRDTARDAGDGLVLMTVGGKMSAYGPGSRFGILHDSFGIPPATQDLAESNHGQAISFEFVHKTNPDWLFVIDRDAAIGLEGTSAHRLLDNELMHKTAAWQNDQVVYLDAMNWYLLGSAGLTSLQHNIDELHAIFDARQP